MFYLHFDRKWCLVYYPKKYIENRILQKFNLIGFLKKCVFF